jgi:hypothetical protein
VIQQTISDTMPFESQIHDDAQMIALFDADTLARDAGGFVKLCQASPPVTMAAGGVPVMGIVPIAAAAPPGFFVSLPPEITIPHKDFAQDDVIVRYEICSRFCDNPFTNDAGLRVPSWKGAQECVHNHVP